MVRPDRDSNPRSTAFEASKLTITLPMRVFGEHFWSVSQRIHIFHFVVDCTLYENIRVKFFDKVIDLCPNFRYMDTSSKFVWLFTNEHEQVLKKLGSLLTDRDEMSILYRGPSIDATYHVSVHLAKQFQSRRCFRNRPISNKNCLCRPCLLRDQD